MFDDLTFREQLLCGLLGFMAIFVLLSYFQYAAMVKDYQMFSNLSQSKHYYQVGKDTVALMDNYAIQNNISSDEITMECFVHPVNVSMEEYFKLQNLTFVKNEG